MKVLREGHISHMDPMYNIGGCMGVGVAHLLPGGVGGRRGCVCSGRKGGSGQGGGLGTVRVRGAGSMA